MSWRAASCSSLGSFGWALGWAASLGRAAGRLRCRCRRPRRGQTAVTLAARALPPTSRPAPNRPLLPLPRATRGTDRLAAAGSVGLARVADAAGVMPRARCRALIRTYAASCGQRSWWPIHRWRAQRRKVLRSAGVITLLRCGHEKSARRGRRRPHNDCEGQFPAIVSTDRPPRKRTEHLNVALAPPMASPIWRGGAAPGADLAMLLEDFAVSRRRDP